MTLKVIELNDTALRVGDDTGIVLQSPGFALAQDKALVLGEEAEQKARLHPTQSYNKYWHELSLDPLSHGNGIRHYADIAYAQLLHLAEQAGIDDEVLFAVPGNFTRAQLAIVLGLAKQCPFQTVGVVDSALAAGRSVVDATSTPFLVYADLQLHQVVLTRMQIAGKQFAIESVVQVPGVGSQNVTDQLMQLATNAFIQQCRFNPQHNAETEQQLYNALPHWWRQSRSGDTGLVLELRVGSNVHTAKIPREVLVSSLSGHYQKINQQMAGMGNGNEVAVVLSAGLAALPGLQNVLGNDRSLQAIGADSISTICLSHQAQLRSSEQGIRLVTAMPLGGSSAAQSASKSTGEKADTAQTPTHVLYQHRAIELSKVQITNNAALNGNAPAHTIQLQLDDLPAALGKVQLSGTEVLFDSASQDFLLNNKRVSGKHKLRVGDQIRFTEDSDALTFIHVH